MPARPAQSIQPPPLATAARQRRRPRTPAARPNQRSSSGYRLRPLWHLAATAAAPDSRAPVGTLRTAIVGDPSSLEGHLFAGDNYETVDLVFDQLTNTTQLRPQPMLAESWDVSSDFKQIKLNLRKGVQFHTGREFTSDDVKYNFLRVRDPKVGAGQFASQAQLVHRHRHTRQIHGRS